MTAARRNPMLRTALMTLCATISAACALAQTGATSPLDAAMLQSLGVPEGAVVRNVDTVAALTAQEALEDGTFFAVRGFHQPGDDGGGVFRYDQAGEEEPDGGAVLKPVGPGGRFIRLVDPLGPMRAEWFGACGDGAGADPHDDKDAINACLARFGRVKLLGKVYGVRGKPTHYDPEAMYHSIDLRRRYRIEGSGREATTIKLLDGSNPKGSAPGNNYFNLISNLDFYESVDHVIIRDLTVDCNFDGQNKHTTLNAIGIRGGNALVERCNFRGYGTGCHPEGNSRECFAVNQTLCYKVEGSSRKAATFRDLDFTGCGSNGSLEGHVGEITHIGIGGADNFDNKGWILPKGSDPDFDPANGGENESNWWPSYGGLVEDCVLHDESVDPAVQKSPLHAITYSNCIGMTVRNNKVLNFEGVGVFVMSWWNRGTTIVDNEFNGVSTGVALHIKGSDGVPLQKPLHEDVTIERNTIKLCQPMHHQWSPRGIHLYGQDLGTAKRLNNIVVRNNTIEGRAYTAANGTQMVPAGINLQILRANYDNLLFENNTLDFPDYGEGTWVPQEPHSMAIIFFPLARWDEDAQSGNVVFRWNRNPDGKELYPILADWYFKNPPTWGKPGGAEEAR